jgi:hypothetical protein
MIRQEYSNRIEEQILETESNPIKAYADANSMEYAYILLKKRFVFRLFKKKGENLENPDISAVIIKDFLSENEFLICGNQNEIGTTTPVQYTVLENATSLSVSKLAENLMKLGFAYPSFLHIQMPAPIQFAHIFVQLFGRILEQKPFEDAIDYPDYL